MVKLINNLQVNVKGDIHTVVKKYLMLFLSSESLSEKQLNVTTHLVSKYTTYVQDGVKEPYCSQLLFDKITREEMTDLLGISKAHFNNTLSSLVKKGILAKSSRGLQMNPNLVPASSIKFSFTVDDNTREDNSRGSVEVEPTQVESTGSSEDGDEVDTTHYTESPDYQEVNPSERIRDVYTPID